MICGIAFVLSGQGLQHGTLSTVLVMLGCDIFTILHSVAFLVIFNGTQGKGQKKWPKIKICRFLLTRCVIVVGNLSVLLRDEWITHMLASRRVYPISIFDTDTEVDFRSNHGGRQVN